MEFLKMPLHRLVTEHPALRKSLPVTLVSLGLMTMGAIFAPAAQAARFTFSQTGYSDGPIDFSSGSRQVFEVTGSFGFDDAAFDDGQVTRNELTFFNYAFKGRLEEEEEEEEEVPRVLRLVDDTDSTFFTATLNDLDGFSFGNLDGFSFGNIANIGLRADGPSAIAQETNYFLNLEGSAQAPFDNGSYDFELSGSGFFRGDGRIFFNNDDFGGNPPFRAAAFSTAWSSRSPVNIQPAADPVPTPAMLPGLFGMGVAAWRKRRSASTQQSDEQV
ncbi:PTPA-CTERM sorting domain-containing protein [filamentous cyanobacterium LEGE 11480]|uniref:PTPA-CTERM sorting domain-containing protein n=1 Tax=Romeriopsis navalis LEGE 11480 TaxID=2777977 RepID=A0A928VMF9_9CYAN|nr:PTPA-CTERM sorting domain-containing protein [Romeriopsis navalis]MBE9031303.1 PTPA-CTERM sorting domain-containing protein [Romeriopsis navalis LEGE 11480]